MIYSRLLSYSYKPLVKAREYTVSIFVKMPFARSNETGKIISITEADRGNACNCRCLSCNTPVTARQADRTWHFSHRTDKTSTDNECYYSPVTAIALIIRQQLPSLQNVDLDDFAFDAISWEIDIKKHGVLIGGYAKDPIRKHTAAIDIPFPGSKAFESDLLISDIDIILTIDTTTMANTLYAKDTKPTLLRPDEIFQKLLENWEHWVTMLHSSSVVEDNEEEQKETDKIEAIKVENLYFNKPPKPQDQNLQLCACCNIQTGALGGGILCKDCVRKHVGTTFQNLTEMVRFYR